MTNVTAAGGQAGTVVTSGSVTPVRRRRWWMPAVALVLALLGAWVWAGRNVELSQGSWGRLVGADQTMANDGFVDTAYVIRGAGPIRSTLHLTIRNNGRFPVTVLGDDDPSGLLLYDVRFATLDQMAPLSDESLRRLAAHGIRLAAGQEAELRIVVDVDRCLTSYGGGFSAIEAVGLRVRQLGLTTSVEMPLEHQVRLVGPDTPRPANC